MPETIDLRCALGSGVDNIEARVQQDLDLADNLVDLNPQSTNHTAKALDFARPSTFLESSSRTTILVAVLRSAIALLALLDKLSKSIQPRINDRNDVDDPVTPTPQQRQQQPQAPLRRTHIEAASVGISPSPSPPKVKFAEPKSEPQLSDALDEADDLRSSTSLAPSSKYHSPEDKRRPHRALRISKNTASAILYTLEEALRRPNPFTPDLIEENASMSDLSGGPSGPAGVGRPARTQVPGTTGSPNIRGPRDIMRERQARERRKAEDAAREELERANAEEEARLLEQRRRDAERRPAAGAAPPQRASGEGNQRGSGGTTGPRISDPSQQQPNLERPTGNERPQDQSLQGVGRGGRAVGGGEAVNRVRPTQPQQPKPAPQGRTRPSQAAPSQAGPSNAADPPVQEPAAGVQTRSSFPHAFERWETLSAHWEGLTSYWIRRLEENSNEINREPISQQLSRQVTDLAAAGANLFHAVVELQRLRASSERKFQRWFFETRAEQERHQEIQAIQEQAIEDERRRLNDVVQEAVEAERKRNNSDKQLAEMRRELQIAKEEARRAWDELGRREQEERDRTASLREGLPTIVGGVQVVPMMQGVPSRHGSARAAGQAAQEPEGPVEDSDTAYQQYSRAQRAEPADPFVEQQSIPSRATPRSTAAPTSYADYTQAPAVQPVSSTSDKYYQQPGTTLHPAEPTTRAEHSPSRQSYGSSDEEYAIDAAGNFLRDARGNKVPYPRTHSDDGTGDEYDVAAAQEQAYLQQYGRPPVSGVSHRRPTAANTSHLQPPTGHPATRAEEPVDYSGSGYGSGPGWEAVPRHHHPTRLSDVLEEDERSRTSASQVSRRTGD
ncbi:hypothetical protein B0O99DRAFT_667465 [Bisporella sp. PMI_857]|nr:hypothetical protein B0O99DRAFT_667465 [Bisporella sp. PMI_857]